MVSVEHFGGTVLGVEHEGWAKVFLLTCQNRGNTFDRYFRWTRLMPAVVSLSLRDDPCTTHLVDKNLQWLMDQGYILSRSIRLGKGSISYQVSSSLVAVFKTAPRTAHVDSEIEVSDPVV